MSVSRAPIPTEEFAAGGLSDDRARFVESPGCRNRGSRGALTGVLLGVGLWGVILTLAGVIKL